MKYPKWLHCTLVTLVSIIPLVLFGLFLLFLESPAKEGFGDLAMVVVVLLLGPGVVCSVPSLALGAHYLLAKLFGKDQTWTFYPRTFIIVLVLNVILLIAPWFIISFSS